MARSERKVSPRMPGAVDEYIGVQMRRRRLSLGMSQAEVATKLGVTQQQVHKYENGRDRVSAAWLIEICEALDVPLTSMFERQVKVRPS
jgi:transcriptional regulator with XRE-family HTH domain